MTEELSSFICLFDPLWTGDKLITWILATCTERTGSEHEHGGTLSLWKSLPTVTFISLTWSPWEHKFMPLIVAAECMFNMLHRE